MKNIIFFGIMVGFLLIPYVLAEQNTDIFVRGFEVDKLLSLGSGILATLLFMLTLYAYKRNRIKRLLYVILAFLLFSIKGLLLSLEIWFGDWALVDIVSSSLDFAILLSFFFGVIKK